MRLKKNLPALSLAAAFALTGCVGNVSYPTIEPLTFKPSAMAPAAAVEVDSLTPTFKWRCPDPTEKDDLAIWRLAPDGSPGETFIFKRNIVGGQYTLEEPLTPGEEYFWSVKFGGSFIWAKANYVGVSPLGAAWQNGLPFKIKAPLHGVSSAPNAAPAPKPTVAVYAAPAPVAAVAPIAAPVASESATPSSIEIASVPTPETYADWEPYIGGYWVAKLPPESDGLPKEMRRTYSWANNKEGVIIKGVDLKGGKITSTMSGLTVWNANEHRFHFQGSFTNGLISQSSIVREGDSFVGDITQTAKDGTVNKGKARMKLINPNLISYQLFEQRFGEWIQVLDLNMERHSVSNIVP